MYRLFTTEFFVRAKEQKQSKCSSEVWLNKPELCPYKEHYTYLKVDRREKKNEEAFSVLIWKDCKIYFSVKKAKCSGGKEQSFQ